MIDTIEDQAQKNLLLGSEQKGFDYFIREIKLIIFNEEGGEEGMLILYIQTAADYLQMHWFPFHRKIQGVWKASSFLSIIFTVVGIFNITNYLPNINYLTFIVSVYILLGVILLIILDILYVSYSFSRKRFAMMWPLYVLRSVASLVVTVFFLPITETLISVIECQTDDNGVLMLRQYPDIQCYVGWHLLHSLLSLFFTLLFVIICAIVAYAFFEPRMNSGNRTARQDSMGEVAFIMNKVICQVLFSFLSSSEAWILVLTTFGLSVWLFIVYNFAEPYYDNEVGQFYNIVSTIYLWTNFLLLVSKLLETTSFNGGMIAWIIGLPFIVMIMLSTKKSRIDTLVRSQMKFRSGEQVQGHLRYVLQLVQNQSKDKNAYMLLIGYIEKHKETCDEEDCPLKSKKTSKKRESVMDEQIRNLLTELNRLFLNGLKKFPNCTILRLSYAFFLLERMKNKNRAYEQLQQAQKGKPSLDDQFIIYRYQKIIKENLDEQNESNADIVSVIAFDNHITLCEEYMKLSANFHKEFWAELKEEQPDLGKLNIIGSKISRAVNEAKDNYNKMQKINSSVPQSIKVFGTFLLNVLNDKTKGQELLKQAKIVKDSFRNEMMDKKEEMSLESQPVPFIYASAKKSDQGNILNCNQLFTTVFGFQKEEVVGKKVNFLMPKLYASAHDKYIQLFIENMVNIRDGQIESDYIQQDQEGYYKHKNGQVMKQLMRRFIFFLKYKVILNLEQIMFVVTFRGEPTIKSFVHFIINQNTQIIEMSTGAITYFDLDLKQLQANPIRLDKLIADVLHKNNREVYYQNGDQFYGFNCIVKPIILPKKQREDSDLEENKEAESSGYFQVKLERLENFDTSKQILAKKTLNSHSSMLGLEQQQQVVGSQSAINLGMSSGLLKTPLLQKTEQEINQEQQDLEDMDQQFVAFMEDLYATPKYDDYKDLIKNINIENDSVSRFDYADHILTRRLINNQVLNIDEEKQELFLKLLEEEEQEDSIFGNKGENFEDEDDYKIFTHSNSTGLIKKALNTHHSHIIIKKFKRSSTIWILFIIGVTILQYYFCITQFQSHLSDVDVIQVINKKLVDLNKITSRVFDFYIMPLNLQKNINQTKLSDDVNQTSYEIIQLNKDFNSFVFKSYLPIFHEDISFRFYQEDLSFTETIISLESALILMTSYSLNITQGIKSEDQDAYVQSVIYNFFNLINYNMESISSQLIEVIKIHMSSAEIELLVLLIILIVVSTVSMVTFIMTMFKIKMQRENILFLFLDIPQQHVDKLYKKCEKFLKTYVSMRDLMAKNEMEGFESSDEENQEEEQQQQTKQQEEDEQDNLLKKQQNRRKIIKKYQQNKFKGNQGIILQQFKIKFMKDL